MLAISSYLTDTISIPEVIWTVAHLIGFYANLRLFRMARENLAALRHLGINSLREFAAISSLISESLRVMIQFVFLTVGFASLFIPAANVGKQPTFQWALTCGLLIVAFMLVGSSYVDKARREALVEKILALEDMGVEGEGDGH